MSDEIVLPLDSSKLFEYGELQNHNFYESNFSEEDVGTPVIEFDLSTADTSNVKYEGDVLECYVV